MGSIRTKSNAFVFLQTHFCTCATISAEEKSCQILEYFNIYYRADLRLLICFEHCCGLPLDIWANHIQEHHRDVSNRPISRKELLEMKDHIAANFRVAVSVADLDLPENLSTYLPMKTLYEGERPSVLLRYRCPVASSCRVWSVYGSKTGRTHQLSKHIREKHMESITNYQVLGPRLTQNLRIRSNYYHTFILPDDWKDPESTSHIEPTGGPATVSSPIPKSSVFSPSQISGNNGYALALFRVTWPTTLGWTKYRNTTLQGLSFSYLRRLIITTTSGTIKESRGSGKWVESGLLWVFGICAEYLRNANLFLDEYHNDIRDEITSG